MKRITLILFICILSGAVQAQDTTGGTRPNIVIPLHKDPAETGSSHIVTGSSINKSSETPDEIRIRNNSRLKKKKVYRKKEVATKPKVIR